MPRFIVICQHDAFSEPRRTRCFDTYEEALPWAGEYWKAQDLAFDLEREDPFHVLPNTYAEEVDVSRDEGRIMHVMHAHGDGCVIWILPEAV
jgi:hypothetical protein